MLDIISPILCIVGVICFIICQFLEWCEKHNSSLRHVMFNTVCEIEERKFDTGLCAIVGLTKIAFGYDVTVLMGYENNGAFKQFGEDLLNIKVRSVKQVKELGEKAKTLNYDKYAAQFYNKYMEQLIDNTL